MSPWMSQATYGHTHIPTDTQTDVQTYRWMYSFVINMLIMNTFIPYAWKWRVKTYNMCPKVHLDILTKLLLQSNCRITMVSLKIMNIFSCNQKCKLHMMAEIERGCGIPCDMSLWRWKAFIMWQHLIFYLFTLFTCIRKIVKSWDMFDCQAIDLPSTKQIVPYYHV